MGVPVLKVRALLTEPRQQMPDARPSVPTPRQRTHSADSEHPLMQASQNLAGRQPAYSSCLPDTLPDESQLRPPEVAGSENPLIQACLKLARESKEASVIRP